MNRRKLGYVVLGIFSFLQLAGGLGIFYLDSLSRSRMGAGRHVMVRKKEFLAAFMSAEQMDLYRLLLVVVIVAAVAYLAYQLFRRAGWFYYVSPILSVVFAFLLYLELVLEVFRELPVFSYLLLVTGLVLVLELLKILVQLLLIRSK